LPIGALGATIKMPPGLHPAAFFIGGTTAGHRADSPPKILIFDEE
jgi:hypothetical protein